MNCCIISHMSKSFHPLIVWFEQVGIDDVPLVGGKGASLGELYNELTSQGINVPYGFIITTKAYDYFLEYNNLKKRIEDLLSKWDGKDDKRIEFISARIRSLITSGDYPLELRESIAKAYSRLCEHFQEGDVDVAVRSSATSEDLEDASFAGQQDTYLNVRGIEEVFHHVKKCFASLFTHRAIKYRQSIGYDHFKAKLAVVVQKMVRSDLASSGVMFTIHPDSGHEDILLINSMFGLGEAVVQGNVIPDEFMVHKPTLKQGYRSIIFRKMGDRDRKEVYDELHESGTTTVIIRGDERKKFSLSDEDVLQLAQWGIRIEEHYSRKYGVFQGMDIEWAKDGLDGKLYVVQARPETVHSRKRQLVFYFYRLKEKGRVLLKGIGVGDRIASGKVKILHSPKEYDKFEDGDILVTEYTSPDWEPIMARASAIITERGGRTSHAAIVSREMGWVAVVGAKDALNVLKDGMLITVDTSSQEEGLVYEGSLMYDVVEVPFDAIRKPKSVDMMMIIGNPSQAIKYSRMPNDGVGLARMEFIYANWIGIHPLAILNFDQLDEELKEEILERAKGYASPKEFFVSKLAEGIGTIASAFYPRDVIVRFSDFKSNEYAQLLGGHLFEPTEENPMLGWRGASRYYSERFKQAFLMELEAIKRVREDMGLRNVKVMVPFCRTPEEGKLVLDIMEEAGYGRGTNGLEVYVMVEIPSNVILAEEFAKCFDGFSIGSNDLTQLVLGVDRDSALVSHIFDERHPAVKLMLSSIIDKAKKLGRKVGICGQAPSDYPEIAEFLMEKGIDSISLTPDAFPKTSTYLAEKEQEIKKKA